MGAAGGELGGGGAEDAGELGDLAFGEAALVAAAASFGGADGGDGGSAHEGAELGLGEAVAVAQGLVAWLVGEQPDDD